MTKFENETKQSEKLEELFAPSDVTIEQIEAEREKTA